jgi:hypothetical protein
MLNNIQVGYPFNQIPVEAFTSATGGYGQATLCGSLGVAATCIGAVCDVDTSKKLFAELSKWYKKEPFPTYQPEGLKLPQTVADSVLCEVSVGKFMEKSGFEYGSAERKSRCASVAGEVTKKMVELLNAHFA